MLSRRDVLKLTATGLVAPAVSAAAGAGASATQEKPPAFSKGERGPNLDAPIIVKWRFDDLGPIYAPPAIADSIVYLGGQGSYFYALDIATGQERWRAGGLFEQPTTPFIVTDLVFVHSQERRGSAIQAFDLHTGVERWRFGGDGRYVTRPVVEDAVLYTSEGENFYALDTLTGTIHWQTQYSIVSPKAILDGVVYGIDYTAQRYRFLVAFDIASRSNRWMTSARDDITTVTATQDTVYLGSMAGDFHAVDAQSGTDRWSFSTGDRIWSDTSATDDLVYVDGPSTFFALDVHTGAEQWRFSSGTDRVFSAQAVVDSVAYVGSLDRLFALDATTGEEIWRFETGNTIAGPAIAVAEGVVCAVYGSSNLIALGNPATLPPEGEVEYVYTPK